MKYIVVANKKPIPIGRIGENEVTTIRFSVNAFFPHLPDATSFTLFHQRPGDVVAYPCVLNEIGDNHQQVINGYVEWVVKSGDIGGVTGNGTAQLTAYRGSGVVAKTVIFTTVIANSIGVLEGTPDPFVPWTDRIAGYADTALNASADAQQFADNAAALLAEVQDTMASTYAPKESPALTGTPTAPTAAAGTNTTQIATTAFVKTAVDGAMDIFWATYGTTTNAEIAAAYAAGKMCLCSYAGDVYVLGYALSASHTFTCTGIGSVMYVRCQSNVWSNGALVLAPKESPALTGTPTAPTASSGTNTTQIATTAFVQGEKVSPAFTGTPTAPTASAGTNTTQIATTAFVKTAVNNAPKEIFWATYGTTTSAQIETAFQAGQICLCKYGDNTYLLDYRGSATSHTFVATVSSTVYYVRCTSNTWTHGGQILAPQNSPTFTGTPAAPTASSGTNTTQIATTAFVKTAVDNAKEVFWATYGTTTSAEIEAAYQAGKIVACIKSNEIYILNRRSSASRHTFTTCLKSGPAGYLDVLTCNSDTWSYSPQVFCLEIPPTPDEDGTYTIKCTVSGATKTCIWEAVT